MKKTLALLLALAMSCTMLASCDEDSSSKDSSSKADSSVTDSSVVDSEAPADSSDVDSSEAPADSSEPDSSVVDSSEPDSSVVDSSEPDSSEPDSSEPETPDEPDQPTGEGIVFGDEITTDDRLFETLVAEMAKGSMTMEMEMEQDGMSIYICMVTDGKSTYTDMNMMGIAITALSTPDGAYYLDTAGKRYYKDPTNQEISTGTEDIADQFLGEDQKYVKTLNVTIDGEEYVAENYTIDGDEGYFAFNADGDLVAVIAKMDGATEFTAVPMLLSAKADAEKLTLPADYTAMTDQEFTEFYGALMG